MTTAVVFDLDGTLIDSVPDLAAALNKTLAEHGQSALDLTTITGFVGNGLPKLVERAMRHCKMDLSRHGNLVKATLAHYTRAPTTHTVLYPGVRDMLDTLAARGHPLGICTNKPEAPARLILDLLDLSRYFGAITGGDTHEARKPDPLPLHRTFQALGAETGHYVGDSEVDAETAKRAGVPFLLFTEGYRKTPVAGIPHDVAYADSTTLPDLVNSLNRGE